MHVLGEFNIDWPAEKERVTSEYDILHVLTDKLDGAMFVADPSRWISTSRAYSVVMHPFATITLHCHNFRTNGFTI